MRTTYLDQLESEAHRCEKVGCGGRRYDDHPVRPRAKTPARDRIRAWVFAGRRHDLVAVERPPAVGDRSGVPLDGAVTT